MYARIALLFALLLTAACATPYQPYGYTGGYQNKKVSDNEWIVAFYGNGHADEPRVWNFWIYRCAELTLESGYSYFSLSPADDEASNLLPDDGRRPYRFHMLDPEDVRQAAAGGDDVEVTPVYYTVTYVTTYSSRALVTMYKSRDERPGSLLLDAAIIKEMLGSFVTTNGEAKLPDRDQMLLRAATESAIRKELEKVEEGS